MNILIYKIAEKFGKELAKAAAIHFAVAAATDLGGRCVSRLFGDDQQAGPEGPLFEVTPSEGVPVASAPPINIQININSNNRRKDNANNVDRTVNLDNSVCPVEGVNELVDSYGEQLEEEEYDEVADV